MKKPLLAALALTAGLAFSLPVQAADKLTVILEWFVNPDHAALVVAQEKGYFAEAGLDVDLIAPADPNDAPKLVAAGKADLGVGYQPQLHVQVGEGLPLRRVATLVGTPLNILLVKQDGPIKTIKDLKGKRIGYSVPGFEDAVLMAMLQHNGLKAGDVQLINVNFSLSPSLISGQVDAVIGSYRNFELTQMALEGHPGRAFFPEEEGVPVYDELILLAHKDRVNDPRLRRFVDALEKATLYIANHPDEAWALFIAHHKDLDDELNRRAWTDTLPRLFTAPAGLDSARYARFAAFLKERGLIKTVLPVSDYAVQLPF